MGTVLPVVCPTTPSGSVQVPPRDGHQKTVPPRTRSRLWLERDSMTAMEPALPEGPARIPSLGGAQRGTVSSDRPPLPHRSQRALSQVNPAIPSQRPQLAYLHGTRQPASAFARRGGAARDFDPRYPEMVTFEETWNAIKQVVPLRGVQTGRPLRTERRLPPGLVKIGSATRFEDYVETVYRPVGAAHHGEDPPRAKRPLEQRTSGGKAGLRSCRLQGDAPICPGQKACHEPVKCGKTITVFRGGARRIFKALLSVVLPLLAHVEQLPIPVHTAYARRPKAPKRRTFHPGKASWRLMSRFEEPEGSSEQTGAAL